MVSMHLNVLEGVKLELAKILELYYVKIMLNVWVYINSVLNVLHVFLLDN